MSFSIEDFSLDFFSLHNKVAIVTGAAGELGRGLCSALAKAGANLLLVDIKEPDNKYLKHLTHEGVEVEFMTIDITKPDATSTIINRCLERFGQLDILVNNAGVCNINRPIDFNRNDWDPMINLNLNAAFDMSQAALNIFVPQRKGKIINMCSVLSFHGGRWSPGYAATKHALAGLTKAYADDFAAVGFDLVRLGDGAVDVKGTPADMPLETIDELIYDLLQTFARESAADVRRSRIAAELARSGARPMSHCTSQEEAANLLERLCNAENRCYAPSGKPILSEITPDELRAKLC